jgi:SAM-dependent methyltransferase
MNNKISKPKTRFGSEIEKQIIYLKEVFQLTKQHKLLDIGCDEGYLSYELFKEGYDIFGLDIIENRKDEFIDTFPFELSSVKDYSPNFEFDFIVHFTLHLNEAREPKTFENLFKSYNRLLKVGGKVIIDFIDYHSIPVGQVKTFSNNFKAVSVYTKKSLQHYHCLRTPNDPNRKPFDVDWRCFEQEEFDSLCYANGFKLITLNHDYDSNIIGSFVPNQNIEDKPRRLTAVIEKISRKVVT